MKRILLKYSGEALGDENGHGLHPPAVRFFLDEVISSIKAGFEVAIVVGGGNFFRGAKGMSDLLPRDMADKVGILGTIMNGIALREALIEGGHEAALYTAVHVPGMGEAFNRRAAQALLGRGGVAVLAGGVGQPYFTTDSGAVLRAIELECDAVLKATQVDGVYDKDPNRHSDAKRHDSLSYDAVLANNLNVMDMTAFALARDNAMPIIVFNAHRKNALLGVLNGEVDHTRVGAAG